MRVIDIAKTNIKVDFLEYTHPDAEELYYDGNLLTKRLGLVSFGYIFPDAIPAKKLFPMLYDAMNFVRGRFPAVEKKIHLAIITLYLHFARLRCMELSLMLRDKYNTLRNDDDDILTPEGSRALKAEIAEYNQRLSYVMKRFAKLMASRHKLILQGVEI